MLAKVNVDIKLKHEGKKHFVKLYDVDPLFDDLLESKVIYNSTLVEFLFDITKTGELRPELQIRVFDENDQNIYMSEVNDSLCLTGYDKNTRRVEKTTVEFKKVIV